MRIKFLPFALVMVLAATNVRPVRAATINAASCSSTDVQNALNAVSTDGTTVVIPAGTCSWSSTVTYNMQFSTIVQGASTIAGTCGPNSGDTCVAADNTTISDNVTGNVATLVINTGNDSTKSFRLTGITLNYPTQSDVGKYGGALKIGGQSHSVRVDHNHFNHNCHSAMEVQGSVLGVVDHNRFDAPNWFCVYNGVRMYDGARGSDASGNGHQSWANPTAFGTADFMFVENNHFINSFALSSGGFNSEINDCMYGAKQVIRYNKIIDNWIQTHGTGSGLGGNIAPRGCRASEVYNNNSNGPRPGVDFDFMSVISGPALIWGNTVNNAYQNFITMHAERRANNGGGYPQSPTPGGWGYCGTTFNGSGSSWDQNINPTTGYRCLDQPGQGQGDLLSGNFPNVINTRTGGIGWPRQALEPVYVWGNTYAGNLVSVYEADALFQNTDFYINTDGGVASGTSLPATCSPLQAFWNTSTQTLYQCKTTNTWTSYYTPYTYPHPLAGGSLPPPPPPNQAFFSISDRGSTSLASGGQGSSVSVGYGQIEPNPESTTPSGIAIFDFRQNNILVSEVGVPATPALSSGRIYAEITGALDAGLAIANPNSSPATISFYFTDANGNPAGSGSTTIGANQQMAQFLDLSPFKVYSTPTFQGTFSFTSSLPVAVVALRAFTNERSDFLMSTLPVIDTTAAPNNGTIAVAHFADGGGWATNVLLVNPTDNPMTGTVQFLNPAGAAANVTIAGQTNSSFVYSVPKRTSQKLSTDGLAPTTATGSIRIVPTGGGDGPTPLVVFSNKPGAITVSETGVPVTSGNAFRTYVEYSGVPGQQGNIDSGIAVANPSSVSVSVTFDVTDLTGGSISGVSPVTIPLPAAGQTATFLSEIFPSLEKPFKGVLRITTTSTGLSVVGLRTQINERSDFLITTTPPTNENVPAAAVPMYFPQVADGGGYTTQFILFSGTAGQVTSGTLNLVKQDGSSFGLTFN